MYMISVAASVTILINCAVAGQFTSRTAVSIDGTRFRINGNLTYEGLNPEASGKLMNIRMVNSVFDDENPETQPEGFDPEVNTDNFIKSMDEYKAKGILAFTINLQGRTIGL